jgi:hypothetical protein
LIITPATLNKEDLEIRVCARQAPGCDTSRSAAAGKDDVYGAMSCGTVGCHDNDAEKLACLLSDGEILTGESDDCILQCFCILLNVA